MKKLNIKKKVTSIVCLVLVILMVIMTILPSLTASAETVRAIIMMDNNKSDYKIGEEITFGVKLPSGVKSFDFTLGYSSSTLELEKEYKNNRVHVKGNYFSIKAKVVGNGKLYFKASEVDASNGYPYAPGSILRNAGNGKVDTSKKDNQKNDKDNKDNNTDTSECLLSKLSVKGVEIGPSFDKYVDIYWADIKEAESVAINAEAKNKSDKITVKKNGKIVDMKNIPIDKENELVEVIVSSKTNSKTYKINVSRDMPEVTEKPEEATTQKQEETTTWTVPENNESTEEAPEATTESNITTEKREMPFNGTVAVIICVVGVLIISVIVLSQMKESKKEYELSDEAYRINEEKERQKRIEQRRKEKQGENGEDSEEKKGRWKKRENK